MFFVHTEHNGNKRKGIPSMRMLVFKGNLFYLLFVGLTIFGGCGDDDPTDEWVGRWTVEMLDGENVDEEMETTVKLGFLRAGGSVEDWDLCCKNRFDSTVEFTFGDDSRWEFVQTGKWDKSSFSNALSDAELKELNAEVASQITIISTGSYIVTDDEFTMQGDKRNVVFKGKMSGSWKRSGSKLTMFGDGKSGFNAMVLSK